MYGDFQLESNSNWATFRKNSDFFVLSRFSAKSEKFLISLCGNYPSASVLWLPRVASVAKSELIQIGIQSG